MWHNQIQSKLWALAFIFPVCVLMGWVGLNEYRLKVGKRLVLPVEGYDPRDLLSGHYLRYKVRYGMKCPKRPGATLVPAYACFKPKKTLRLKPPLKDCSLFLKGQCFKGHFLVKDLDRYYIPEKKAQKAEKLFRNAKEKQVVLSVLSTGHALVQDILVEGKSLKKQLR